MTRVAPSRNQAAQRLPKRQATGSTVVYREADGLASDNVRTLARDLKGTLWVGTESRPLTQF